MLDRIAKGLRTCFEKHRIVFWYDPNREFGEAFEAIGLPGVQKIRLANTEFAVKHRVLRQEPKQHFLIYREGPKPAKIDNWLLDVELGHGEFRTDQVAIWLTELGLPANLDTLVRAHEDFFRSTKRLEKLKANLPQELTPNALRLCMLATCVGADAGLDTVVEELLAEKAAGKDEAMRLITRTGLDAFLWAQVSRVFGYGTDQPSLGDLVPQGV
jgi:hypothetical protein